MNENGKMKSTTYLNSFTLPHQGHLTPSRALFGPTYTLFVPVNGHAQEKLPSL